MRTVIFTLLVSTLLSCSGKPQGEIAYDWPRWRGPNGDGVSRETNWNPKALDKIRVK